MGLDRWCGGIGGGGGKTAVGLCKSVGGWWGRPQESKKDGACERMFRESGPKEPRTNDSE